MPTLAPTPSAETPAAQTIAVTPWIDPIVDERGHDPRSTYAERFWLPTLGPTATLLLRRVVDGFDDHPHGFRLDLSVTAHSLGLGRAVGQQNAFAKAFRRCVLFGLAHQCRDGFAVRRLLPPIARRHLERLPEELRRAHATWLAESTCSLPGIHPLGAAGA